MFTDTSLNKFLPTLPIRTYQQQISQWSDQKHLRAKTTTLIKSLGKPAITVVQAKRLDALQLDHQALIQLRGEASNVEDFSEKLKKKGVNSKLLRAKLGKLVKVVKQEQQKK